jgi:hypothetical protein
MVKPSLVDVQNREVKDVVGMKFGAAGLSYVHIGKLPRKGLI